MSGPTRYLHDLQDRCSLALNERVAMALERDPALLKVGADNLARWSRQNADAPSLLACYAEWGAIISRGLCEVVRVLRDTSDEAQRLRQNSPFAGVLTPREVWRIKDEVRARMG
jgi:hypothetical protein